MISHSLLKQKKPLIDWNRGSGGMDERNPRMLRKRVQGGGVGVTVGDEEEPEDQELAQFTQVFEIWDHQKDNLDIQKINTRVFFLAKWYWKKWMFYFR